MDRRSFLARAGGIVGAALFIPAERLLMGVPRTPSGLAMPERTGEAHGSGLYVGEGRSGLIVSGPTPASLMRLQYSADGRAWVDVPDARTTTGATAVTFQVPPGYVYVRTVVVAHAVPGVTV